MCKCKCEKGKADYSASVRFSSASASAFATSTYISTMPMSLVRTRKKVLIKLNMVVTPAGGEGANRYEIPRGGVLRIYAVPAVTLTPY